MHVAREPKVRASESAGVRKTEADQYGEGRGDEGATEEERLSRLGRMRHS